MAQVVVRNIDDAVVARLKEKARRENLSLEQKLRQVLTEADRPSREEVVAEMDRIRAKSPYAPLDSTVLIREDRDNDEPYR